MDPKIDTIGQVDIRNLAMLTSVIWPFWGSKKYKSNFLDFFEVVLELFKKSMGIVTHSGGFEGSVLPILGVKKVVFWTSKLFWSCLGSVWALFSNLKGLLLGEFSALKVDK